MNRRTRILELRSVRGTGGGPEKTIMMGASHADRSAFEVIVCYIRDRRDTVFTLDDRAARMGIDYREVHERHSLDPSVWFQLRRLVGNQQIDIVHAHEYKTDLIALLLARRTGVIPLATAHGWTGQSARERLVYYPLDKRLLVRFPKVIAVSSEIRQQLLSRGAKADRVVVLLNSIDSGAFARVQPKCAEVRTSLGYRADQIVIGAVGRMERQKRFDLLLEAVAPLMAKHSNLHVALVGDGALRQELMALADRLKIGDRCLFLGQREDIADLHHGFDLFVQSSEYEGTPNAVLEAMAMETPLVATDVGGTRELATHGIHAILTPSRNVAALRSGIEDVLVRPQAARFRATAARHRVETELSFEARTRNLEHVYLELVKGRRNRDGR
jgi:glycosyltransferase involved in cell wall biosynthesis